MSRARAALAAFVVGGVAVLAAPVGGRQPASPSGGPNPLGKPDGFHSGKQPVVAIWFDTHWHFALSTSKKGKGDLFTGTVRADKGQIIGVFDKLEKGKDGKVDWIVPHKDGGGFDFRFTNFGFVDKTQFKVAPAATKVTFNVFLNGAPAPQIVLIGKDGTRPDAVPFSLPAHPKP